MFFQMNRSMRLLVGMIILVAGIAAILAVSGHATAATLEVGPGQTYTTIQSAIDASAPGDEINVHAGIYSESLVIPQEKHDIMLIGPNEYNFGYDERDPEAIVRSGGTSPVLSVHADNVTVVGFSFNYSGTAQAIL